MKNYKIIFIVCKILFLYFVVNLNLYALSCKDLPVIMKEYLKLHYSFNTFDDELSKRTLDLFLKSWDPGKYFFYNKDIIALKNQYNDKLDDLIFKVDKNKLFINQDFQARFKELLLGNNIYNPNCSFINQIINLYAKRFQEQMNNVIALIDTKHNFQVDEYIELDRKSLDWAESSEELKERWRKRVKFQLLQLKNTLKTKSIEELKNKLKKRYALEVKRQNEETLEMVYERFLNSFASSLDPHSSYMSERDLEEFRIETSLSLEGIGALLKSEDGFTIIMSLVPGGAAAKTGKIKVNDKIIAVAQGTGEPIDVIDMDLKDVVKLIRGPKGTEVRLTIMREEHNGTTQLVVPVIREKIQLEDREAISKVFPIKVIGNKNKEYNLKIGVLNLPSFYIDFEGQSKNIKNFKSASKDVLKELIKLNEQKIDALIVDLRANGGGGLAESIKIAGYFIKKGPIVQIKELSNNTYPQEDTDQKIYYSGPLLTMVSRQTASASEIFSGAMQDYNRAIIVGDSHTYGKGTVQTVKQIKKLGSIKVTISKFYRPSGSSTQLNGVSSDIVLPSLLDVFEIGEKYSEYPLAWEQISKLKLDNFNMRSQYLKTLQKRSKERIKQNKDFKKLAEEINKYIAKKEEKYKVSLKEDNKAKQKQQDDLEESIQNFERNEINIDKDIALQETLNIAADYVQLINNRELGKIILPLKSKTTIANKKAITKPKKELEQIRPSKNIESNKDLIIP